MRNKNYFLTCLFCFALLLFTSACKQEDTAAEPDLRPTMNTDRWLGKWAGPEGTSLSIEKDGFAYRVTITDLDGPRAFKGYAARNGLSFMRDNETLTIHPGNGADTGMKYLTEKKSCLVVKNGEGYCRN